MLEFSKMDTISVKNLVKTYQVFKKEPGILGTFKSLVSRKYEKVKAVDDISFSIKEGELVGFIGPNGAGKTTTLKCLSGLLYPTSGEISVLNFKPWQRKRQFLKNISFVMGQKNQLWWDLPAIETFLLNKEIFEINDSQFKKTLGELVDLLDAKDILNIQVKRLSLGQRMKCELIAALIHLPKVLFLDEPTIGLDVVMQEKLREFVKSYNKNFHSTIILTSHYMEDVQNLAKRVIVINFGKIVFDGLLTELVKKKAPYKLISFMERNKDNFVKIKKLGKIIEQDFPKLTIRVSSKDSNRIASQILDNFTVEDLTIEEADIAEIIREVFEKSKK